MTGTGSTTYTIDTTPPAVTALGPTGAYNNSISRITVTFNKAVDSSTFTPSAITLVGPTGTITVNQPQLVSGTTYSITFAPQATQGTYTLTVAPSVADLAGNAMAQPFTGSFTVALPDLAVTSASAPTSAVVGSAVPVSWTVTNQNTTNPAIATWTDAVYLSTRSVLDGTAVALLGVSAPPQSPLAAGGSYTLTQMVNLPGNLPAGSYYLLFVTDANGAQAESDSGNDANDLVAEPVTLLPTAQVSVVLDPASDSGAPDHPGFTNDTTPTFDVRVNQAGTITVDFDGNPAHDQTVAVAAGTYQFTAPGLADGAYTATATFSAGVAGTTRGATGYTILTHGAHVTSMSPTGTIRISATQITVTFNEPVDPNTLTPAAVTLTGPNGPIAVNQPQSVSGSTYSISFATQITDGTYTLTLAPGVADYAGNEMDQNQNGINGESTDAFTGSFSMTLPVGGPIALNTPTLGFVPANRVGDWTFFGRAGQAITAVLDPGAAGTVLPPPALGYARLALLDPSGNVLATTANTQGGVVDMLSNVPLPADGTYDVRVQAPAAQAGVTGFYNLTVADATVHQTPIAFNETVAGRLEDAYSTDRWTFSAAAGQGVQFHLAGVANPGIVFDLTGPNGYTAFSGATASSNPITLPAQGSYTLTVRTTGQPGAYAFEFMQQSVIDLALNDPTQVPLAGSGQAQLFAVTVGTANPLELGLTDTDLQDHNEVYVSYGTPPTRNSFQYRYTGGAAADQTVVLAAQPGTYYILVYDTLVKAAGSYTIEADSAPFLLSGMTPGKVGNAEDTTLQFTGVFPLQTGRGGYVLGSAPAVQFIASNGTVYPASPLALTPPAFGTAGGVNPDGTMTVSAVLPGGVLPAGTYSVRITDDTGYSQTLTDALTVDQGGLGILKTNVIVPNPIGFHEAATIYVQYTNVGDAPLAAPILVLTATQNGIPGALLTLDPSKIDSGFWTSATPDGFAQSVQFLASGSVPGVIQPGETESVPVYYAGWLQNLWDFSRPPIDFSLGVLDDTNTQAIDWSSLQGSLRPASISQSAWNGLFPNLSAQLGSTWGSYVQQLDNDAQYLAGVGENVTDIGQLFNFEVQQANGYSLLSTLASATDAQVAAPGLPLSFAQTFSPGVIARNQFGRFGWGWSDSWETSLTVDPDGSVNVLGPNDSQRRFQPDSRGGYFAQASDHGTLAKLTNGGYTLTELSGEVTAYNPDGTLNYAQDTNGNRITAGYTNGLLTRLTHSSGQFLAITYNGGGLISSITDSAGRTTTYNYDPANQYLMSVVDFDGQTTAFTYDLGSNTATAHALLSVTHSDGSHDYFSYDAQGRLADAHRDDGADDTTFAYSEGRVSVTDAMSDTTRYFFDNRGLLVQLENPLQNTVHYTYDNNLNLIQTTDAAGQVYVNTYDSFGDLISTKDPLGHTVNYTYQCNNDRLASVTDGNGNTTLYGYDGKGNLTSTTYADGTLESVAYDPIGNVLSSKDRKGQVAQYTHDAAGNILTETFTDSTETVFTYDSHENLTSATDAGGMTILTYDANDRLIEIAYPSGHYLKYNYDSAGRRTQMVDDTGFTVNYSYDAVDNLVTLTDSSNNLLVRYSYDPVGRLSREDKGNGTYTTYEYDAASELLHLVNYAPDGTVNSRFDYAYDNLGHRITEATLDGVWSYSYDAIGELTHAVFVSTNPSITNQDLTYFYDAAGNRTQTIINGVTTQYTTNNLNEYTQIGDRHYNYGANGNIISATDNNGVTIYTYNTQDQLIGVAGATGSRTYQYDPFGNRVTMTENGQTTLYLTDLARPRNFIDTFGITESRMGNAIHGTAAA